jgi:lysophospholipase L1-like esterase
VRTRSRSTARLLIALAGAVPGLFLLTGCSDSPSRPTQVFESPQAICPAPVVQKSPNGMAMPASYGAATTTGGTPPTTVLCSPASGSTFPIGTTTVACTATDSVGRAGSCTFGVTLTAPPRLSVTRFLAFGDSMTWGEDGTNAVSRGGRTLSLIRPRVRLDTPSTYPGALQIELAGLYTAQSPTVDNQGVPGELVTASSTFSRFAGLASNSTYDVVLLMEGANDLVDHGNAEIVAALNRIIDYARSQKLKVFLATIPPENPDGSDPVARGRDADLVPSLNRDIANLAVSKGSDVTLVDVNQAFGANLSLIGGDGLHPTAAGYKLIADTFFAKITQMLQLSSGTMSSPSHIPPQFVLPRRR